MFEAFFSGVLLGLGVAVPFGPINILILSYALKSFSNSFCIGFGAMSADIMFLCLLNFGLLGFLKGAIFTKILAVFGFIFLTYIAFSLFKSKHKALEFKEKELNESLLKSFIKGFTLNAFYPYVIGFWLSIAVIFTKNEFAFFMIAGLFLFILFWIFSLSFFVGRFSHLFSVKVIYFINIRSAIIIEYFALNLVYKTFLLKDN